MTDHITFDYPPDGTLETFPTGTNIINFTNGVITFADGTKKDLPYQLSDYDHDVMNYLYITTEENILIKIGEFGKRNIIGIAKINAPFKYIYIITTSPTPLSFFVSTDKNVSIDISEEPDTVELITTIEYDSDDDPIYIGESAPSSLKSASVWRIKKITYDASKNPIDIQYADGTQTLSKIWDDRASYDYS
jgi:hypothetical protein